MALPKFKLAWTPSSDQRKHIVATIDKGAFSFVGGVGYNTYVTGHWLFFWLAIGLFFVIEGGVIWYIGGHDETK